MYNYNAPWHTLKRTCLGRSYGPDFYAGIRNSRIRDTLMRIAEETEQDYQGIQRILEQAGVEVVRPTVPPGSILDYTDRNGRITHATAHSFTLIPRPPMQPRDCHLIVGDRFLATNKEIDFYKDVLDTTTIQTSSYVFDAPYVTVIGQDLIVDRRDYPGLDLYMLQQFPDHNIVTVDIGGHNDAVFAPVCPGAIVSTYDHTNYAETFPGWDVLYIPRQSWNAIPEWRQLKHSNLGKWWMPEAMANPDFAQFVDTWLNQWTGYVQETVFDVNMLSVNESQILVNNYNRELFAYFKTQGIEPIVAGFRHRFFWDGGIHCVTSDLHRVGECEHYVQS